MTSGTDRVRCRGIEGDPELGRVQVWEDDLGRLTTSVHPTETARGSLHLAPHWQGDSLSDSILRGEFVEESLPSGATLIRSKDFPPVPEDELRDAAERIRDRLLAG